MKLICMKKISVCVCVCVKVIFLIIYIFFYRVKLSNMDVLTYPGTNFTIHVNSTIAFGQLRQQYSAVANRHSATRYQ